MMDDQDDANLDLFDDIADADDGNEAHYRDDEEDMVESVAIKEGAPILGADLSSTGASRLNRSRLNQDKSGLENCDTERINRIIREASEGSWFYKNVSVLHVCSILLDSKFCGIALGTKKERKNEPID
jgi:hypothetical protein